jgi:hypothetical protein
MRGGRPRPRRWSRAFPLTEGGTAICYSHGEATALSSHISRGGYGGGVEIACGRIPNKNKRGSGREHAVLLRRTATGRKRGGARA